MRKINHLRQISKVSPIDILCVDEGKLHSSYHDVSFQIDNYQFPYFRRDRNKYGGGKSLFLRIGFITRKMPKFEAKVTETICVELTISKKEWFILFRYRPPQNNNLEIFLEEINLSLSFFVNKYDYIMLIGDLNLNMKSKNNSYYYDLCDTFDLTSLIKACFKSSNQTSINGILTNRPRGFKKPGVVTTGLSDCHKMILTFFCTYFSRCSPKAITCRGFRYFETKDFLFELESKLLTKECNRYDDLRNMF